MVADPLPAELTPEYLLERAEQYIAQAATAAGRDVRDALNRLAQQFTTLADEFTLQPESEDS